MTRPAKEDVDEAVAFAGESRIEEVLAAEVIALRVESDELRDIVRALRDELASSKSDLTVVRVLLDASEASVVALREELASQAEALSTLASVRNELIDTRGKLANANHWRKRWSDDYQACAARCQEYFMRFGSLEGVQPPRYSIEAVDALLEAWACSDGGAGGVEDIAAAIEAVRASREPKL